LLKTGVPKGLFFEFDIFSNWVFLITLINRENRDPLVGIFPQTLQKTFLTISMEAATVLPSPSFKEDTYFVSNLKSSEKKAL